MGKEESEEVNGYIFNVCYFMSSVPPSIYVFVKSGQQKQVKRKISSRKEHNSEEEKNGVFWRW